MSWISDADSFQRLRAALRRDPDLVFLTGYLGGRRSHLSVSTIAEDLGLFWIEHRDGRWRASARVDGGGKLILVQERANKRRTRRR